MDASLRNAKGMQTEIERLQANLIRRFTNLVNLAEPKSTDRGVSAVTQYQIQTETAALIREWGNKKLPLFRQRQNVSADDGISQIRATEDVQTLIRHMQEMWLFGQLNTLGESELQRETDSSAREAAGLLRKLEERRFAAFEGEESGANGVEGMDGSGEGGEDGDRDRNGGGDGEGRET